MGAGSVEKVAIRDTGRSAGCTTSTRCSFPGRWATPSVPSCDNVKFFTFLCAINKFHA